MIFSKNRKLNIILLLLAIAALVGVLGQLQMGSKKTAFLNSQPQSADSLEAYYQKSQELSQNQSQKTEVIFLAGGDIMLSRNVAAKIQEANNPLLPFEKLADVLKSVDFSFANLESPFFFNRKNEKDTAAGIIGGHSLNFGAPQNNAKGLVEYNFKVLNLANNHALDQSQQGLAGTRQLLEKNGLQPFGAGNNLDEAWQPVVMQQNGIKICFLGASYASYNDGSKATNIYVARIEDKARLKASVETAKAECDFTVVSMHAGTEYTREPNQAQTDFAHAAIDNGADLVIGAHPHWIQTIEKYNGKYIFYSLGNFIFDQDWSQATKEGLTLKIKISKKLANNSLAPGAAGVDVLQGNKIPTKLESIELLPVIIENNSTPRLATPEEAKKILEKINQKENVLE